MRAVQSRTRFRGIDRRSDPRITLPFPAMVRGVDAGGQPFEEKTTLDNLSAHGLHLRIARPVAQGKRLFIVVRFSTTSYEKTPAPEVALRGVVVRSQSDPEGRCAVAVALTHHRFLYDNSESAVTSS